MKILPVDLNEMEHCNFAGLEVDVLQLNGSEIWSAFKIEDKLILNVSSKYNRDSGYILKFSITPIEDVTITFNDSVQTLLAGSGAKAIDLANGVDVTGDLIIEGKCEFRTYKQSEGTGSGPSFILNEIKQWGTTLNYLPDNFLGGIECNGVKDINIPKNIEIINVNAFLNFSSGTTSNLFPNQTVNIYLPKKLKKIAYPSVLIGVRTPLNAVSYENAWYIDSVCLGQSVTANTEDLYVREGTTVITSTDSSTNGAWSYFTNICLNEDGALKEIPEDCFLGSTRLSKLVIPASVTKIGNSAFNGVTSLKKLIIKTPSDVEMTLGSELFYYKNAWSITIFTDNESVKNYDFAGDNVTPTIYPLHMADWETLSTPTVTIDGTVITITPVDNATEYAIYSGTTELFRTTETTIDLAQYQTSSAQNIYVQALGGDGYLPSTKSTSVSLSAKRLSTPQISISDTILTITPVENATEYLIYKSETGYETNAKYLFTTTETTIDLTEYKPAANSVYSPYYFYVVASDGGVNFANSYMSDFVTIHRD